MVLLILTISVYFEISVHIFTKMAKYAYFEPKYSTLLLYFSVIILFSNLIKVFAIFYTNWEVELNDTFIIEHSNLTPNSDC